jgi:hypothetical protein
MSRRFYVEASEFPRVIDSRDGFAVFTADQGEVHTAENAMRAMNRTWERDVTFVGRWLEENADDNQRQGVLAQAWREEMLS